MLRPPSLYLAPRLTWLSAGLPEPLCNVTAYIEAYAPHIAKQGQGLHREISLAMWVPPTKTILGGWGTWLAPAGGDAVGRRFLGVLLGPWVPCEDVPDVVRTLLASSVGLSPRGLAGGHTGVWQNPARLWGGGTTVHSLSHGRPALAVWPKPAQTSPTFLPFYEHKPCPELAPHPHFPPYTFMN